MFDDMETAVLYAVRTLTTDWLDSPQHTGIMQTMSIDIPSPSQP